MSAQKELGAPSDTANCAICGSSTSIFDIFEHLDTCKRDKFRYVMERFALPESIARIFQPPHPVTHSADANMIIPGLMLGSVMASRSEEFLTKNDVRAILNCAAEVRSLPEQRRKDIGVTWHAKLDMDDVPNVNFEPEIRQGIDKLAQAMILVESCGGSVLVHCAAGVSRSATVVMGYLMCHKDMTLENAALLVKRQRSIIYPNTGFWKTLRHIESLRREVVSVPSMALRLHEEYLVMVPKDAPLTEDEEEEWKDWFSTREAPSQLLHATAM